MAEGAFDQAAGLLAAYRESHPQDGEALYLGVLAEYQRRDFDAAARLGQACVAAMPEHVPSRFLLGLVHRDAGNHQAALDHLSEVTRLDPGHYDAWFLLGLCQKALNRSKAAVRSFERAHTLNPSRWESAFNAANALAQIGKSADAIGWYDKADAINPDEARIHLNRADALAKLRCYGAAQADFERAAALAPEAIEPLVGLGVVAFDCERLDEARAAFEEVTRRAPDLPNAWVGLGRVLHKLGLLEPAAAAFERTLSLDPHATAALEGRGIIAAELGDAREAERLLMSAYRSRQPSSGMLQWVGRSLMMQGRLGDAELAFRETLETPGPPSANVENNLANIMVDRGRIADGLAKFDGTVGRFPERVDIDSNRLMTLQYRPGIDEAELLTAHRSFADRHAARYPARRMAKPKQPGERLRVGFVSADMRRHPVGWFLLPVLKGVSREALELHVFSDGHGSDDLTAALRQHADGWDDTAGLSNRELAALIEERRVHVLFDLAGHTAHNRMLLFARRAAPAQVTWAGYVGTTGLSTMDAILADAHHIPPGHEQHYCEQVYRMPDLYTAYEVPSGLPEVGPSPTAASGHVTFGCFNTFAKVNADVLALWAQVLNAVPNSRLVLVSRPLADTKLRLDVLRDLERHGIDPERTRMHGHLPHAEVMDLYNRIDIALDPFPYTGGYTTLEALWMGVPTVTLRGRSFAGRHATAYLRAAGFPELVTETREEYARLAIALSNDPDRLAEYRRTMRDKVRASPVSDREGYCAGFAEIVQRIYRDALVKHNKAADPVRLPSFRLGLERGELCRLWGPDVTSFLDRMRDVLGALESASITVAETGRSGVGLPEWLRPLTDGKGIKDRDDAECADQRDSPVDVTLAAFHSKDRYAPEVFVAPALSRIANDRVIAPLIEQWRASGAAVLFERSEDAGRLGAVDDAGSRAFSLDELANVPSRAQAFLNRLGDMVDRYW